MLSDAEQLVGVILASAGALILALFLPREPKISLRIAMVGLALTLSGAALSALRSESFADSLLMNDLTQFGKMIPVGYAMLVGGIFAYVRAIVFRSSRNGKGQQTN